MNTMMIAIYRGEVRFTGARLPIGAFRLHVSPEARYVMVEEVRGNADPEKDPSIYIATGRAGGYRAAVIELLNHPELLGCRIELKESMPGVWLPAKRGLPQPWLTRLERQPNGRKKGGRAERVERQEELISRMERELARRVVTA